MHIHSRGHDVANAAGGRHVWGVVSADRLGFKLAESKAAVILCVDDEPNALLLRKLVLQKAGYDVLTATSGFQALDVLTAQKVDLVLSDQLMPGQTGTELARQIKGRWPSLPVILLSGVNEIPPDAEIADLFLSKVEGPINLCQSVNEVLTRARGA